MKIKFDIYELVEEEKVYVYMSIHDKQIDKMFDPYYYALDNNVLPNNETYEKIIVVVIKLLEILIEKVNTLNDTNQLLFPLEFYDEYVGFLIINSLGSTITIDYGITTEIQGYSYYPTDFGNFNQLCRIFSIENWDFKISKAEFLDDINWSISCLKQKLKSNIN